MRGLSTLVILLTLLVVIMGLLLERFITRGLTAGAIKG